MPDACPTCTKPLARIDAMRADEDWECAHVDCPSRRRCWSEGVHAPRQEAVLPLPAGLAALFDSPRQEVGGRVISMAAGQGMGGSVRDVANCVNSARLKGCV